MSNLFQVRNGRKEKIILQHRQKCHCKTINNATEIKYEALDSSHINFIGAKNNLQYKH